MDFDTPLGEKGEPSPSIEIDQDRDFETPLGVGEKKGSACNSNSSSSSRVFSRRADGRWAPTPTSTPEVFTSNLPVLQVEEPIVTLRNIYLHKLENNLGPCAAITCVLQKDVPILQPYVDHIRDRHPDKCAVLDAVEHDMTPVK